MTSVFHNRDFTRLFAGRLVTNAGDSIYFVAAMWLVYELTRDPFLSGVAGFLTLGPQALQALAGPLVDRWNLRRVLVVSQALQAVLVLTIPAAHLLGVLSVWLVLVVMPLLALLNQFVYPAESASLPRIVEREQLVAANSAFSFAYQGVDLVFNALAGILVAVAGAMVLFVFDSLTFLVAALLFATVRIPPAETDRPAAAYGAGVSPDGVDPAGIDSAATDGGATGDSPVERFDSPQGYFESLREGVAFLRGTVVALMLGGSLLVNFALGGTLAVLPVYADTVGGPALYGLFMAAFAGGLLAGALAASLFDGLPFGRLTAVAFALSGVCWLAALAVEWVPLSVALFALAFVPAGITNVLIISLIQALVPERLLGRVMSVVASGSALMMPVGALAGGAVAAAVGPVPALQAAGLSFLVLAGYVLVMAPLRRMPAIEAVETLSVPE